MRRPHALVVPYPAQGHVIPLMEVAHCLAENGIKITFVNTDFNHTRIVKALSRTGNVNEMIRLASIPDGLEPWEDRNDLGKLTEAMMKIMPLKLEALIENINEGDCDKITCVVADYGLGWALEIAKKFEIKRAAFLPTAVCLLAIAKNVWKLMEDGIIDSNGTPLKQEAIRLSPNVPEIRTDQFVWTCIGDLDTQKTIFMSVKQNIQSESFADRLICNSSYVLEPGAFALVPNCLPIGPLLASNRSLGTSTGHFWQEDDSCLTWLDKQPSDSTIYVAFGSFTLFDQDQFQELALGLELSNRPFLWVVRQDTNQECDHKAYPEGFMQRIKNRGKIVRWAPQQKVLSHRSVSCFMSHCGWNSTVEGVSNGVPFLCWPYFADQFLNESYVSDHWEIGLRLDKDECGIVRKEEIKNKVELLLNDDKRYRRKALDLQAKIMSSFNEGGCCRENLNDLVNWIKEN